MTKFLVLPRFVQPCLVVIGLTSAIGASAFQHIKATPERDLTTAHSDYETWSMGPDTLLKAASQTTAASDDAQNPFQVQVVRKWKEKDVKFTPGLVLQLSNGQSIQLDNNGVFKSPVFCQGTVNATINFESAYIAVGVKGWNSSQNYSLQLSDIPCTGSTTVWAEKATPLASVLSIWSVGYTAVVKMKAAVGLDFWKSRIDFNYPGDGAYYSDGTVNIPNGEEWDTVGHELGHGIFDLGNVGRLEGGEHYIDRCYSETLALSEGWASYFSAFLSVGLDDKDAKFEFMVPRRSPIRFETIPADVCNGYGNEWRVVGFLWDIIDSHEDNEIMGEQFSSVWNATVGKMASSLGDFRTSLLAAGFNSDELGKIWNQNASGGSAPNPFENNGYSQPRSDNFQFFDDFINRR